MYENVKVENLILRKTQNTFYKIRITTLFRILRILFLDQDQCDGSVENKYKRKMNVYLAT